MSKAKAKVLFFDIETSPLLAYCWGMWEQNISLNQIKSDWFVLSWSAKWQGDKKVLYQDQRKAKNIEDDSILLKGIWKLLDEADVVVTQNGKKFDVKKLNARFIMNGMKPPSGFKHIDTLVIAKKIFGFTSNKLEYMTDKLCVKYKKQKHKKFSGFELWSECLKGNPAAWREMEVYNKYDVLSLEELFDKISPWDVTVNFNLYHDEDEFICNCGSKDFQKRGFTYTASGKYQRFCCSDCGAWNRGATNLFTKEKKQSLRKK
jgi:uncharacterized protein YprB with RNaseH-like and TPR domain